MSSDLLLPQLSQEAQEKIKEYIGWSPQADKEKKELNDLLSEAATNDCTNVLENRFLKRLQFGTAGLRGRMGCGYNCMNDLIVIQTSQGIAAYLLQKHGAQNCQKQGVVIGYDGRHHSKRFAHAAAATFLAKNFKVYLNSQLVPTPLVPFAILKYGNLCGVQVTASHNAKHDNGYKVYAENGAQIIPPMDTAISSSIMENLKPWDEAMELLDATTGLLKPARQLGDKAQLLHDPYQEIFSSYLDTITKELCLYKDDTAASDVHFVYTPMHGVGAALTSALVDRFGLKKSHFHIVDEQSQPDPEFSTVAFPNPEEKGALDCSMALADKLNVKIILANDPDADRFACAEKQPNGSWKVFTGDELGFLFAVQSYEFHRRLNPSEPLLFLCSAVSSRMLHKFAQVEKCEFTDTSTGFKWIMNKAIELTTKNSKLKFCMAYEEALGYALSMQVRDKDGISACAFWIQFVCQMFKTKSSSSITEYLQKCYAKYGQSVTSNSYFICHEPAVIQEIFDKFRDQGKYRTQLGQSKLARIRDVTARYDNGESDGECKLPYQSNSEMITLYFTNGVTITFRTSGTEPKFKWYSELIGQNSEDCRKILQATLNDAIEHFVQYSKYEKHLLKAPDSN